MKRKAIALFSGGLEVLAITFLTDFGCVAGDTSSCSKNAAPAAAQFGFDLKLCHLGQKFVDIVKQPRHGHGRNMNPCIDCRILMLREAGVLMEMTGADFVVTGEVLGQRPMSQQRNTLNLIEKESGLTGLVVRPLSARLLPISLPEARGIIDRRLLLALSGRTRKPQMALAREWGLSDYPAPAGGCLLTDPLYSKRLRDLLRAKPDPDQTDLGLLRIGRHFRPSDTCKIVVGRNEAENSAIGQLGRHGDIFLQVENTGSPLVLLTGPDADRHIGLGASLCARYSDLKHQPAVTVSVAGWTGGSLLRSKPAGNDIIELYRIQ
jgi:hypothetical protein